jgi:hypothetical protein
MSSLDLTPRDLASLVLDRIAELGDAKAAEYFNVSGGTVSAWKNRKNPPSLAAAQKCWDDSLICSTPELWGDASDENKVQILLPIYREVDPLNHITLFINYRKFGADRINIIPRFRTLIDEARNDLVQKALKTKSVWFVMCDSDMILPIGNPVALQKHGWNAPAVKASRVALTRLMSWGEEYKIVGALYRDRKTGHRAQCERAFRSPQENLRLLEIMSGKNKTDDGLEENGWVATGFMRIHRSVFEMMAEEAKPGKRLADIAPAAGREGEPFGFFGRTSQWRGEDIAFCRRAGMLGIKSFTDCGLVAGHRGNSIY